jgi:hypothetical protein
MFLALRKGVTKIWWVCVAPLKKEIPHLKNGTNLVSVIELFKANVSADCFGCGYDKA